MNQLDQLSLSLQMTKQAVSTDTVLGVGSMIPGIGAGFSAASAGRNFMQGNWGKGLADVGWTALNLVPGGGLLKGLKAMPRIGKMLGGVSKSLPWTTSAAGAVGRVNKGIIGGIPGVKAFQNSGAGKWIGNNQGKASLGVMGAQALGGGVDALKGPSMKDRAFDTVMSAGNMASSALGGQSADPRMLTPKAMPAPLTTMFN